MNQASWKTWRENFRQGAIQAWDWMGVRGIIFEIGIALVVGYIFSTTVSDRLQLGVIAGVTLLVAFSIYIFISLFFIIFKVSQAASDREEIINRTIVLRSEGVKIRNRGQTLVHEDSIQSWWHDHLKWREKTAKTISLLDKNLADNWKVLGTFTPKRDFPNALSPEHRHKLRMFDAWLERLDEVVAELRGNEE